MLCVILSEADDNRNHYSLILILIHTLFLICTLTLCLFTQNCCNGFLEALNIVHVAYHLRLVPVAALSELGLSSMAGA